MSNPKQRINAKRVLTSNGLHLSASAINVLLVARAEVTAGPEISIKRRDEYRHALGAILKVAGNGAAVRVADRDNLDLGALLELHEWLRALRRADPSLRTVVSRARAAIRAAGIPLPDGRRRPLLSPPWGAAQQILKPKGLWGRLSDFPHWASAAGIAPPDITGGALEAYRVERYAGLQEKGARRCYLIVVDAVRAALVELGIGAPGDLPGRAYGGYRYCLERVEFDDGYLEELYAAAARITEACLPYRQPHPGALKINTAFLLRASSAYCSVARVDPKALSSVRILCDPHIARIAVDFVGDRTRQRRPGKHTHGAYGMILLLCALADSYDDTGPNLRAALRAMRTDYAPPFEIELSVDKQSIVRAFSKPKVATELRRIPHLAFTEAINSVDGPTMPSLVYALALELGLKYGLWPYMLAGCRLRDRRDDAVPGTLVEIVSDRLAGSVTLIISKTCRGAERTFELAGRTVDLLTAYLNLVRPLLPGAASSSHLIPGRGGAGRSPASLSRGIANLVQLRMKRRITAGHLGHIAATILLSTPGGSRENARIMLGRCFYDHDQLFDTIENWLAVRKSDLSMTVKG